MTRADFKSSPLPQTMVVSTLQQSHRQQLTIESDSCTVFAPDTLAISVDIPELQCRYGRGGSRTEIGTETRGNEKSHY